MKPSKKCGWMLLIVAVITLGGTDQVGAAIPTAERNALIDLYNSTGGVNWTNNDGWLGFHQTSYQGQLATLFENLGDGSFDDATLRANAQANAAEIERQPLWNNLKHEHGPFDIIGDVHGRMATLRQLVRQLGYGREAGRWHHPEGRVIPDPHPLHRDLVFARLLLAEGRGDVQRHRRGQHGQHQAQCRIVAQDPDDRRGAARQFNHGPGHHTKPGMGQFCQSE